jgi:hypothetical protein
MKIVLFKYKLDDEPKKLEKHQKDKKENKKFQKK